MQRAELFAGQDSPLGLDGLLASPVSSEGEEGSEAGLGVVGLIDRDDAVEVMLHHLDRTQRSFANRRGLIQRAELVGLGHSGTLRRWGGRIGTGVARAVQLLRR